MKFSRALIAAALIAAAGAMLASGSSSLGAQAPACLHTGADQVQGSRRQQALRFARHVNTLQSSAFSAGGYLPLTQLALTQPLPQGFGAHLAADPQGYSFSVVDRDDPCRFGFFSNQDGLIYQGQALQ